MLLLSISKDARILLFYPRGTYTEAARDWSRFRTYLRSTTDSIHFRVIFFLFQILKKIERKSLRLRIALNEGTGYRPREAATLH
jgi:hypothetical protein